MFSFNPLWKLLIEKDLTKKKFAEECKIYPATLNKMNKNQYVDMKTLDRICKYLKCNIEDVIKYIPN